MPHPYKKRKLTLFRTRCPLFGDGNGKYLVYGIYKVKL